MPTRNIFAINGVMPEELAYGLARYSRSASSFRETLDWMKDQTKKASSFLDTFYFQYGHKSIADMSHIPVALENISTLAAIELEHEPLWDGQEKSTRYQDFSQAGYYVPPAIIKEPGLHVAYVAHMETLIEDYKFYHDKLFGALWKYYSVRTADVSEAVAIRTLKARAFDVVRSLLPYGLLTSVGQVTSARTLERQISRLMASPYHEVQTVAYDMKRAVGENPPFNPQEDQFVYLIDEEEKELPGKIYSGAYEIFGWGEPLSPTLVKYTEPNPNYEVLQNFYNEELLPAVQGSIPTYPGPTGIGVHLRTYRPASPMSEVLATVLFRYSHLNYFQCQWAVGMQQKSQIKQLYASLRNKLDKRYPLPDELNTGRGYIFEVTLDGKGMQDLYRHRNMIQIRQNISGTHRHLSAENWFKLGLPAEVMEDPNVKSLVNQFQQTLDDSEERIRQMGLMFANYNLERELHYAFPMGYIRRSLFKMDLNQAEYIIKTRTASAGHFSYRLAASMMYVELNNQHPELGEFIEHTPFEGLDFLKR